AGIFVAQAIAGVWTRYAAAVDHVKRLSARAHRDVLRIPAGRDQPDDRRDMPRALAALVIVAGARGAAPLAVERDDGDRVRAAVGDVQRAAVRRNGETVRGRTAIELRLGVVNRQLPRRGHRGDGRGQDVPGGVDHRDRIGIVHRDVQRGLIPTQHHLVGIAGNDDAGLDRGTRRVLEVDDVDLAVASARYIRGAVA